MCAASKTRTVKEREGDVEETYCLVVQQLRCNMCKPTFMTVEIAIFAAGGDGNNAVLTISQVGICQH